MVASMLNEESRVVVESFFEENELLMEVVFLLNHPFFVVFVSSDLSSVRESVNEDDSTPDTLALKLMSMVLMQI